MEKKFELLTHRDRPPASGNPSRYLPGRVEESYASLALTALYIALGSWLFFMGYLYWIAPPRKMTYMGDLGAMTLIAVLCAACMYLFMYAFMCLYEAIQRRIGR